jgi:hypothetical protein
LGVGTRQAFFINPGIAALNEDGDRAGEMMTNGRSIGPGIPVANPAGTQLSEISVMNLRACGGQAPVNR